MVCHVRRFLRSLICKPERLVALSRSRERNSDKERSPSVKTGFVKAVQQPRGTPGLTTLGESTRYIPKSHRCA